MTTTTTTTTLFLLVLACVVPGAGGRYLLYLTGQHDVVPAPPLVSEVTHVALAFMRPGSFNGVEEKWPFFTTVEEVRARFAPGTKVLVAIGGWGDTGGFEVAARTPGARRRFAGGVRDMVVWMGADGVDVDWEYPGGNGEDYKQIGNGEKAWQVEAYPKLLAEIRSALGPDKLISAAVPGLPRDMIAFTKDTLPKIVASVDFLNIMTYDLMNRRDNITKHHTGLQLSLEAIDAYLDNGLPPDKANLGFAFYVKWFRTDPKGDCKRNPIGCRTALMEDPSTGADLGQAGAFAWIDEVPPELSASFRKALAGGTYDEAGGGHYFWDEQENLWWSWDTAPAILAKFPRLVELRKLGGVFAWGLGEDAPSWEHLAALTAGYKSCARGRGSGDGVDDFRTQTPPRFREEL